MTLNSISRRWFAQLCVIAVVVAVSTASSWGESPQGTLIVVSSKSTAFALAADRCAEVLLERSGAPVRIIMINDLEVSDLDKYGAVVAVGARASSDIAKVCPPLTRFYYCMTPSPERLGLTNRQATSGISSEPGLNDQFEWIQRTVPAAHRIGVMHRSSSVRSQEMLREFNSLARRHWTIVPIDLDNYGSISEGIADLLDSEIDLVWTIPDPKVYDSATVKALLIESIRSKTPVFGFSTSLVRAGALCGVGIDPAREGERAAEMVESQITNAHLDAEPSRAVNTVVAERIGVTLSKQTIRDADLVFDGK